MQGSTTHFRPLKLERLEDRSMMAGNVTVKITAGDVVITGDGNSNDIEISQPSLDRFKVTGRTSNGALTKINGVSNRSFFYNLTSFNDDIIINMNGGNDRIFVHGYDSGFGDLDAHDDLLINMGTGNDVVTLRYVEAQAGDVSVDLGTGSDTLSASYVDAADDFIVKNSATSRSRLLVKANLDNIFAGDEINVDLRFSLDRINITNSDADYLFAKLWSGDDKLNIKRTSSSVGSALDGGDGNDDLNLYLNDNTFSRTAFKSPTFNNIMYS
jgi:hypothetical protein